MHPVLIAYQAQLLLNAVFLDIYIKQASNVNPTLGTRTGSSPIVLSTIPAVEEPGSRMFKVGAGGVPQQLYSLSVTFPTLYLVGNELKLNDFVSVANPRTPLSKQRYEIKHIETVVSQLITLRLSEHRGELPGLTYTIPIGDSLVFSDTFTMTL